MSDLKKTRGVIIKGIGGFYYVETAVGTYECKARGIFRKEKITPMVGDKVIISINENAENIIEKIEKRKTFLQRPPVANINRLIIVVSSCEPNPNLFLTDALTAIAIKKHIEPVIVLNKVDLKDVSELYDIYTLAGFKTIIASGKTGEGIDEIKKLLKNKTTAFTGNSGVGKSTLLNRIDKELGIPTAAISQKLGRGKHTTRECTLYKVEGGYVADTPGFASFEILENEVILKEEIQYYFPEFESHINKCKFYPTCAHINDKGCAITKAVKNNEIHPSRYKSYVDLYDKMKDVKEWELK
ncbi:MAG: ribosome small subunit-dependent GTPase A [Ruminococcaceae bacterium]|nr:ribosome small subunit-dependent GTPase A [Oscillospiraceae bacterium]